MAKATKTATKKDSASIKKDAKKKVELAEVKLKKGGIKIEEPRAKKVAGKESVKLKKPTVVKKKSVSTTAPKTKSVKVTNVLKMIGSKKIRKILITQPKPENEKSPYFDLAKKHDLSISFHPFIKVEGLASRDFRKQKVEISQYSAIVLNSRNAVDHFFRICEEMRIKVSQDMKYFCITEAVALYLQKFILYRKRKVFFSPDGTIRGLMDVMFKHRAEKFLVHTGENGKSELQTFFANHNSKYTEITLFKTVSNDISEVMGKNEFDLIVFFSPFSVQTLLQHLPKLKSKKLMFGAFGPATSQAVIDAGWSLHIKAPIINAPSMVSALDLYLEEIEK